jgi:hypothetical protein
MADGRGIGGFLASALPHVEPGTPRVRRGGRKQLLPVEVALDDARRRAGSGEWEGAKGSTLVGLYALCHQLIYGIVPEELRELPAFRGAAKQAAGFVHAHFGDDYGAAAAFVKWAWEREKKKHVWALKNGATRNRMSWRLQFSASLLTDWRVERQPRRR